MLHLLSDINPNETGCSMGAFEVISTKDANAFIDMGIKNQNDICEICADQILWEENYFEIYGDKG